MNKTTQAKDLYIKSIDDNKHIPDDYKPLFKDIIACHFLTLGQVIGNMELLIMREQAHYQQLNKELNKKS